MRRRDHRAALRSALLSFVLPGLGQLLDGRRRAGVLFIAPVAVGAVAVLLVLVAGGPGLEAVLAPGILLAALVASGLLLAWRVAAVLHAFSGHASLASARAAAAVPWLLAAVIALTQLAPTAYAAQLLGTVERIASSGDVDEELFGPAPTGEPPAASDDPVGTPTPAPAVASPTVAPRPSGTSRPTPAPTPTPTATAEDEEPARLAERVTVLLVGTDDLASRSHRLTDTMMVVSLGAEERRPMMVSVPRDLYGAPLPGGLVYNAKLNSLASFARARPDDFPLGGIGTLRASIELLLGIEIDHIAVIDMLGLVDIVDSLGGVEVTVADAIADPRYAPAVGGPRGFFIDAGTHHMDGITALAYARSRLGPDGNDFVRADRQQRLLGAIRARVRELGLVATLPSLLEVVERNVRTDIPRDRLGELAEAVVDARWDALDRLVLAPPRLVTPGFTDAGAYILRPDRDAIRSAVERIVADAPGG